MAPPDPINANDDRISTYQGQCGDVNCMQPLSINLAIIFGTRLVVNNFLSVVVPYIQYRMKLKSETKDVDASLLTGAEKDYMLQEYHVGNTDLANFADVVMEYGYMIMFVVALPISCLLSMINSYAKVKFAIWRHLKVLFKRFGLETCT